MNRRNDVIINGRRCIRGLRKYVFSVNPEMTGANADSCSLYLVEQGWTIVTEFNHEGREIRTHVGPDCDSDDWRLPTKAKAIQFNRPEPVDFEKDVVTPPLSEPDVVFAIRMLRLSQALLKSQGVLRNQKDFTSQLGEYVVLEMFSGELAESGIQAGWDLIDGNGKKVQVKSHAKAESTVVRSTPFKYTEREFDDLCIVRFTPNYADVMVHRLTFEEAQSLVTNGTLSWGVLPQEKLVYAGPLCADIES